MTKWYVKNLSKITGVSVQTLHHYDKIELLKPSLRLNNGYRIYSEDDLLKLQQIIALKFFGFKLSKIKELLTGNVDTLENLKNQVILLEKKAETLFESSKNLNKVISGVSDDKSIPWKTIIKLIEVYSVTQQIDNTWLTEIFNTEELKQYAEFESELKSRFTKEQKQDFEKKQKLTVERIKNNLDKDPESDLGKEISKQSIDLIWNLYGKKHANLRNIIWEKGFKQGKNKGKHNLTPEVVNWLDKAHKHHIGEKIKEILQLSVEDPNKANNLFLPLLEDMCGDYKDLKKKLIKEILEDSRTNDSQKNWLTKFDQKFL